MSLSPSHRAYFHLSLKCPIKVTQPAVAPIPYTIPPLMMTCLFDSLGSRISNYNYLYLRLSVRVSVSVQFCGYQFNSSERRITNYISLTFASLFLSNLKSNHLSESGKRGGKLTGGETDVKPLSKNGLGPPPPPMIRFHHPPSVHALSFSLEDTGTDQTNPLSEASNLRAPKLVLEGALHSTFPPHPIARYVLPPALHLLHYISFSN